MDTPSAIRVPLRPVGRRCKLTSKQRQDLKDRYAKDPSATLQELAAEYGVSRNTVWLIAQGDPWLQITKLNRRIRELEARLTAKENTQAPEMESV